MRPGDRTLIVVNGRAPIERDLLSWFATATHVVAADGAARHLVDLGLRPDTVIGDFDSITPQVEGLFSADQLHRDPDQDFSDFQKALSFAIDRLGSPNVLVVGVDGDRHDHFLSAIGIAASRASESRIRFGTSESYIHFVTGEFFHSAPKGTLVSILPVTTVHVAETVGLHWPLHEARLSLAGFHSLSNRTTALEFAIRVDEGVGAVVVGRWREESPW